MGEDLALFRDETGKPGLLGLHCAHRGADLSYGRSEHTETPHRVDMMGADKARTDDTHSDPFHVAPPLVKELVKKNDENKEAYSGGNGPHNRRRRPIKIEPLT